MAQAQNGDTVKVNYTGKLHDGTVFSSSEGKDPLEVTIGNGDLIPGFENAIVGMDEGGSKSIHIESKEAYGERDDQQQIQVGKDKLPEGLNPEIGQHLQVKTEDGNPMVVTVKEVGDTSITLDTNHPLAGKDLDFDIELVEISKKSE